MHIHILLIWIHQLLNFAKFVCSLCYFYIYIHMCTHTYISFQNRLKVNCDILPLNTLFSMYLLKTRTFYITKIPFSYPRRVMLAQCYKLIYSTHLDSINCSNDTLYRCFFFFHLGANQGSLISFVLISFLLI